MKARVPISSRLSKDDQTRLKEEMKAVALNEYAKISEQATRRTFELMAVALNERYGFGEQRITRLFAEITRLINEHDHDIEYWEHVNRRCRQIGIAFNFTEGGANNGNEEKSECA